MLYQFAIAFTLKVCPQEPVFGVSATDKEWNDDFHLLFSYIY